MVNFVPRDYSTGEDVTATDMDRIDQGIVNAGVVSTVGGMGLPGRLRNGRLDTAVGIGSYTFNPILVDKALTVTGISSDFYNILGTGGKLRAALYERTAYMGIGNLVTALGAVPISNGDVTLAVSVAVTPGDYWLVGHYDGEGTLTQVNNRRPNYWGILSTGSMQWEQRLFKSDGTWPGSWPTTLTGVSAPQTSFAITGNTPIWDPCPFILTWTRP